MSMGCNVLVERVEGVIKRIMGGNFLNEVIIIMVSNNQLMRE